MSIINMHVQLIEYYKGQYMHSHIYMQQPKLLLL